MTRHDRAGLLAAASYGVLQETLRRPALDVFGTGDCGGTPCWRAGLVFLPQVLIMPTLIIVAHSRHRSLKDWCAACAAKGLDAVGQGLVAIFYAFLLMDVLYHALMQPVVVLRPLMILHHIVCLAGHFYATRFCPRESMPCYLTAIGVLEVGSAACNAFHMWKHSYVQLVSIVYLVVMCASNAWGLWLARTWNARAREGGATAYRRWLPMAIWFTLIFLRQKELYRLVRPNL
jgi:hypothetical protein